MSSTKKLVQAKPEQTRRLSPWRVLLGVIMLCAVIAGGAFSFIDWQSSQSATSDKPWFASYVDVTATPTYTFDVLGATSNKDAILSFIVSSHSDPCTPSWGGAYTLSQAGDSLDLDRRIARLQQQGGHVAVSFGGQANDELAVGCTDLSKLEAAYEAVINRYHIDTIDLDLEGKGLVNTDAGARRASVISKLQSSRRAQGKKLAVWVTLPVTTGGLSEDGTTAVATLLKKVDLAGVNAMTMDYGDSIAKGQSMADASKKALIQTHRQLGILYKRANKQLNDGTLWSKIGATPMIGQNDYKKEVFTGSDADVLNEFARSNNIGRMSMWSANRDRPCGSNYVDTAVVSDSCSGVSNAKGSFATALSYGFDGNLSLSAGIVTTNDSKSTTQKPDDPAKSPYQIWSATGAYLEGTKVVWHHNVYQAKWWTKGDLPDSPVLQSYQTPWELVGPVLPGEKPIPQPTLAPGTYPKWSGDATYDTGQRVLFEGVPYQAKWWTKGNSPAAASSNADSSPWAPLTQAEIDAINAKK